MLLEISLSYCAIKYSQVTWNHQASLNLADTIQLILHSMHSQITKKLEIAQLMRNMGQISHKPPMAL